MTNKTRLKRLKLLLRMLHVMPQMTEALGSTCYQNKWFDDDGKPSCIGGHAACLHEFVNMGLRTGLCDYYDTKEVMYEGYEGSHALSEFFGLDIGEVHDLFGTKYGLYAGLVYIPMAICKVKFLIEKYEHHG